jgi:hypothetical protein
VVGYQRFIAGQEDTRSTVVLKIGAANFTAAQSQVKREGRVGQDGAFLTVQRVDGREGWLF